jgi:hypothetical protein
MHIWLHVLFIDLRLGAETWSLQALHIWLR